MSRFIKNLVQWTKLMEKFVHRGNRLQQIEELIVSLDQIYFKMFLHASVCGTFGMLTFYTYIKGLNSFYQLCKWP